MAVTVPDWLARRGGSLAQGEDGRSWIVFFDGEPQYVLRPEPADGKHACQVLQTVNGKRLDGSGIFPTAEEAVAQGGLEVLRRALGW
jgi:hypothetical protein